MDTKGNPRGASAGGGEFARLQFLLENIQDVIVVLGPKGEILYESPSMERVLGHLPEARVGKSAFDFVHPEDVEALVDFGFSRIPIPGPVPPFSLRFRHADGTYRHLEAVGTNLLENPAVGGVVITLRDITVRVETERRLQEALERAQQERSKTEAILASVGDGISIQDPDLRVVFQNDRHRTMIGDHQGQFCYRAYECREAACEGCPVALSYADGGPTAWSATWCGPTGATSSWRSPPPPCATPRAGWCAASSWSGT